MLIYLCLLYCNVLIYSIQYHRMSGVRFLFVLSEWKVDKKKKGCPAVTLTTYVQSVPISLDVVLCLMVKSSWPPFTTEGLKIECWLGHKVKQDYKREPYYLVPKYEGKGTVENDGVRNKGKFNLSQLVNKKKKKIIMWLWATERNR